MLLAVWLCAKTQKIQQLSGIISDGDLQLKGFYALKRLKATKVIQSPIAPPHAAHTVFPRLQISAFAAIPRKSGNGCLFGNFSHVFVV